MSGEKAALSVWVSNSAPVFSSSLSLRAYDVYGLVLLSVVKYIRNLQKSLPGSLPRDKHSWQHWIILDKLQEYGWEWFKRRERAKLKGSKTRPRGRAAHNHYRTFLLRAWENSKVS